MTKYVFEHEFSVLSLIKFVFKKLTCRVCLSGVVYSSEIAGWGSCGALSPCSACTISLIFSINASQLFRLNRGKWNLLSSHLCLGGLHQRLKPRQAAHQVRNLSHKPQKVSSFGTISVISSLFLILFFKATLSQDIILKGNLYVS